MSKSLNRVQLIGNLGKDPETRVSAGGLNICNFSIATTDSFKDRSGQWQETTDWHNITAFAKLGEVAQEYLSKGSKVFVEGKLKTSSYDDKDGNKRYRTDIILSQLIMLGGKKESNPYGEVPRGANTYTPPESGAYGATDDDGLPF